MSRFATVMMMVFSVGFLANCGEKSAKEACESVCAKKNKCDEYKDNQQDCTAECKAYDDAKVCKDELKKAANCQDDIDDICADNAEADCLKEGLELAACAAKEGFDLN